MGYTQCDNCNRLVEFMMYDSCPRCNAPITKEEEQRRTQLRIENELRIKNGKEPRPIPEVDSSVEPTDNQLRLDVMTFLVLLMIFVPFVVMLMYIVLSV